MVNSNAILHRPATRSRFSAVVLITLGAVLALALTTTASASILARVSLETLRTDSDVIAIGKVLFSRSVFLDGTIQTETFVGIERSFRGPASGTLRVLTLGGTVDGTTLTVPGAATFSDGERVLVFLYDGDGDLRPVGMFQGVWRFRPGEDDVDDFEPLEFKSTDFEDIEDRLDRDDDEPQVEMLWPSPSGGAAMVNLEPGPYAVEDGPRSVLELLGELAGGAQ